MERGRGRLEGMKLTGRPGLSAGEREGGKGGWPAGLAWAKQAESEGGMDFFFSNKFSKLLSN